MTSQNLTKNKLDQLTSSFKVESRATIDNKRQVSGKSTRDKLDKQRIRENELKYMGKIILTIFFIVLLAWQNFQVFRMVWTAYSTHQLQSLELILGVIVSATLTETYFITRIIVGYMFKEIDYHI